MQDFLLVECAIYEPTVRAQHCSYNLSLISYLISRPSNKRRQEGFYVNEDVFVLPNRYNRR